MIDKKHIKCIKRTHCGPFYDNYIAYIKNEYVKTSIYDLRIMNKPIIVKYQEEKLIQYEYYIRTKVRHAFLVNIMFTFQDYDNLFLILEYANIKLIDFLQLKTRFSVKISKFYIAEIMLGIEHLNKHDLVYGFLTDNHILLNDKGHIKLRYEFLNAIVEKKDGVKDFIEFTPPEYLLQNAFTKQSDVWSIGIMLYYLLVGCTPFSSETYDSTRSNIIEQEVRFPKFVKDDAKNLIRKLLHKDPTLRPTFKEIKIHAFFNDTNWDDHIAKKVEPPFFFNEVSKYKEASAADLNKIYTTDYYKNQNKDGYGKIFRYFGSFDVSNPYV